MWGGESVNLDYLVLTHWFGIQDFLNLTSAALYLPPIIHIHLFNLVRILCESPHSVTHSLFIINKRHLNSFCNTKYYKWYKNVVILCCADGLSVFLLLRNMPVNMILCFISVCVCIFVPLWAKTCTGSLQALIRLMSWICVWSRHSGNSPPWHPSALILSITLILCNVACLEKVEFISIICFPGSVVSCVCASHWCLWLRGSACWVLKLYVKSGSDSG